MSIKSDIKKYWPLLMANGVYYLCTGLSEAVIGKEVYAILSPRLISLQSIIGWGGGIVLGDFLSEKGRLKTQFVDALARMLICRGCTRMARLSDSTRSTRSCL